MNEKYENPFEGGEDVGEGQKFISVDGNKPDNLCDL